MLILKGNEYISQMHVHEILMDGYGGSYHRRRSEPPKKAVTDGDKTTLRDGFNAHSVTMPNGCVVEMKENVEIYVREPDGSPRKVRLTDKVLSNLVK